MNPFHRQPTGGFTGSQHETISLHMTYEPAGLSSFQIGDCPLLFFFFPIKCITDVWALQGTYVILPVHVCLSQHVYQQLMSNLVRYPAQG